MVFLIIVLTLNLLGLLEFYRIFRSEILIPRRGEGIVLGLIVTFVFFPCCK